jgi:hypothetical protein
MRWCGPLWALSLGAAQTPSVGPNIGSLKKVTLIVHVTDQRVSSIAPRSVKHVQVIEHGKTLQVVDGPRSAGSKQIALLLDSNFHQRKVLALEQQTAGQLLSEIENEDARALVISYGTEIHSSGGLTNEWASLKGFIGSLLAEIDKHNETVLLYDAMKRAFEKLGDGPGTKAVVVFAEGNDHGSSLGWVSLAQLAERAHIACYVVLFADHSFYGREVRRYGYYLVELAPKTGGKLWEAGENSRKAHDAARQICSELDSQSLIEVLTPDVPVNRFHPIKILISPGPSVKAQTGYYDELLR